MKSRIARSASASTGPGKPRGGRATLRACRDSLADSAKSSLTVGMACAIVGTVIGTSLTSGALTELRQLWKPALLITVTLVAAGCASQKPRDPTPGSNASANGTYQFTVSGMKSMPGFGALAATTVARTVVSP